jgi:hypothetical protein
MKLTASDDLLSAVQAIRRGERFVSAIFARGQNQHERLEHPGGAMNWRSIC